jgi:hypothetical protein
MGKKRFPAPKVMPATRHSFAGPMRSEQRRTVTNPPSSRS